MNTPWTHLAGLAIAGVAFYWWLQDYRANRRDAALPAAERPNAAGRLPGAQPARMIAVAIAIVGALLLLAIETAAEYGLGVSEDQSDVTALFGLTMLSAAFIEELIFRGFIYYDKAGRGALIASCIGGSLLFAVLHSYLWSYDAEAPWLSAISIKFDRIALLSTSFIFIKSLWFYAVRFFPLNPSQSLIPCIAAHAASNLGVFFVKMAQGHVVGWY